MYGQTECARRATSNPALVARKPGSVGKAIPGTELVILSPDGAKVAVGEVGILHVRGPHVMVGYRRRPEETERTLVPGRLPGERMLCTHDWFRVDEEGDHYFVGRSDDIIKTRGEKVSPAEVESVLCGIDGVVEAAVIGVPDEIMGEAVRAHVVLEEGVTLGVKDQEAACRQRLEIFMVPRGYPHRDRACPRPPTGRSGSGSCARAPAERPARATVSDRTPRSRHRSPGEASPGPRQRASVALRLPAMERSPPERVAP
jgi:acyl-coenzyme A synthetase/AMP-(fatty) acid ligase